MEWIKKYKFKTVKNFLFANKMDYLLGRNLSEFDFKEEIQEDDFFLRGRILELKDINIIGCWYIHSLMVEKDLKQIRKIKLNKLYELD